MTEEPKLYTFQFTLEQIALIEGGLAELPGKLCIPLLGAMKQQFIRQTQPEPQQVDSAEAA